MNKTQTVLLIMALVLGTVFVYGKKSKFERQEREHQAARYFPRLETEQTGKVVFWSKEPSFEYTVTSKADRWWLDGHLVALENSEQLVFSLVELKQIKLIQQNPDEADLKEYGFDDPSYRVTVFDREGKDLGTVVLGDRTPDINHFYAQRGDGGPIHTLEAYMLTLIDEKPDDLREKSIFPVEVAAVDLLTIDIVGGTQARLEKKRDKENSERGTYRLMPEDKEVDETKVDDFLNELKDHKVARFLGDDENTDIGKVVARYTTEEDWSKFASVTELCQPVAVNPKLRYGQRYLVEKGKTEPVEGTLERFVLDIEPSSKYLDPDLKQFEDLRVMRLVVDDVSEIKGQYQGKDLEAERLTAGLWRFVKPGIESDAKNSGFLNDVLWALRDLRFEEKSEAAKPGAADWSLTLKTKEGEWELRFKEEESGKLYVETRGQRYLLKDEFSTPLTEALQRILK